MDTLVGVYKSCQSVPLLFFVDCDYLAILKGFAFLRLPCNFSDFTFRSYHNERKWGFPPNSKLLRKRHFFFDFRCRTATNQVRSIEKPDLIQPCFCKANTKIETIRILFRFRVLQQVLTRATQRHAVNGIRKSAKIMTKLVLLFLG